MRFWEAVAALSLGIGFVRGRVLATGELLERGTRLGREDLFRQCRAWVEQLEDSREESTTADDCTASRLRHPDDYEWPQWSDRDRDEHRFRS